MQWVYRSLMAASVILASFVAAHKLSPEWAGIAVAIGTAAGYFSDRNPTMVPVYLPGDATPTTPATPTAIASRNRGDDQ